LPPSYSPDVDNDLPFIDEHQLLVSAPARAVWRSLTMQLPRFAGGEAFAYLLGAEPRRATGKPLAEGATLPAFAVAEFVPERRIRLTGRHRFSRYAFILTLATQRAACGWNASVAPSTSRCDRHRSRAVVVSTQRAPTGH
jgi:hypothetical protein